MYEQDPLTEAAAVVRACTELAQPYLRQGIAPPAAIQSVIQNDRLLDAMLVLRCTLETPEDWLSDSSLREIEGLYTTAVRLVGDYEGSGI